MSGFSEGALSRRSGWGPLSSTCLLEGFQSTCPLRVQGARHRLGWRMGGAEKDAAVIGGMDVLVPRSKAKKCIRAWGERQCFCPDLSALEVGSSVAHSGHLQRTMVEPFLGL